MNHWLVKTEPSSYSWSDLVSDGRTPWDGVRNYQARNNLAAMRTGDLVLVYHSVGDKEVVGIARVTREAYPDPTTKEEGWVAVNLEPVEPLASPVNLATIKSTSSLSGMALVRQGRLSVQPVSPAEFLKVVALGGGKSGAGTGAKLRAAKPARAGAKPATRGRKR